MLDRIVAHESEWRGLWYALPSRYWWLASLFVYLVPPLALALLFDKGSPVSLARSYLGAFVVGMCAGGSFHLLYALVWPRLITRKPGWIGRLAGHAATVAVAVLGGGWLAELIGMRLLGWDGEKDLPGYFVQIAVISVGVLSFLITLDEMAARERALERREASSRLAALRAELAALQARTDPHFLFNSLNTVAALIPEEPRLAEALLERLAVTFRYALEAGRRATVDLGEEVGAVTAYLEVEALRLGDRLRWSVECDRRLERLAVPPLLLQPLVENAVRYGAGARHETTKIRVSVERRGGDVVLAVDDGPADAEPGAAALDDRASPAGGTGTALADLAARLELTYGGGARLRAGASSPGGWRAEVILPGGLAP